jgi:serine/threonine protein kinase
MYFDGNTIKLSLDETDFIESDSKYWEVKPFYEEQPNKVLQGGNGVLFKVIDPENDEECVLKILKYSYQSGLRSNKIKKRIERFEREIEALSLVANNEVEWVVRFYSNGIKKINGEEFPFYIMEKCDSNLSEFLALNELDIPQKLLLCQQIIYGIIELHQNRIYHRDIKSENILFLGDKPLIADLGLADYRDSDFIIPEKGDIIGPIGWMSPEATNKFLLEKTTNPYNLPCKIEAKSEVFQLGKLFWYIFQGNLPIGQVHYDDFLINEEPIFRELIKMLQYNLNNRPDVNESHEGLKRLFKNYQL